MENAFLDGDFNPFNVFNQGAQKMENDNRRDLSEVRVDKAELLERVKENKKQHVAEYEQAMKGWREEIIRRAREIGELAHADDLQIEKIRNKASKLRYEEKPKSHEKDYDHVIDLLKASKDSEFVISSRDFARYWRDAWDWKDEFLNTTSKYKG